MSEKKKKKNKINPTSDSTTKTRLSLYRQKKIDTSEPKKVISLRDIENDKYEFGPNISFEKFNEEKGTAKGARLGKDRVELYYSKKFSRGGGIAIQGTKFKGVK